MPTDPVQNTAKKEKLHPRNLHRGQYDFAKLIKSTPELKGMVKLNQYNAESINFSDPDAVKILNKALLKHFYSVNNWDIPAGYLCPPIPGRADYLHYAADLLAAGNNGNIPTGNRIKVLDVGVGANCVYPLIGHSVYGWQFVGSDIDLVAVRSANQIIASNPQLKNDIFCRLQTHNTAILKGIVKPDEFFDLTICNPPFHASLKEAQVGTVKKWQNLNSGKTPGALLNFGGKNNELWCRGGEAGFIKRLADESALFAHNVLWFSTLVSKKETLPDVYRALHNIQAADVKTITMSQGQKVSRMVAWTFLSDAEQMSWRDKHLRM